MLMGVIFGFLSMIGYGLSNSISKQPIQKIGVTKTIFYRNVFTSIILFVLILFNRNQIWSIKFIIFTILISILGYFALVFFFKSIKIGKVGVVVPVANSSIIITVFLSIIFFKENLSIQKISSLILIILGVILISVNISDFKKSNIFKFSSGVPYSLVTMILWGLTFFLLKIPVNVIGPILSVFIIEFGIVIFSGISNKDFTLPDKKTLGTIFLIAILGAIGILFFSFGISIYDVSIVATISSANPLISTFYGLFVFKEKLSMKQYLATFLIIFGLIVISI